MISTGDVMLILQGALCKGVRFGHLACKDFRDLESYSLFLYNGFITSGSESTQSIDSCST